MVHRSLVHKSITPICVYIEFNCKMETPGPHSTFFFKIPGHNLQILESDMQCLLVERHDISNLKTNFVCSVRHAVPRMQKD